MLCGAAAHSHARTKCTLGASSTTSAYNAGTKILQPSFEESCPEESVFTSAPCRTRSRILAFIGLPAMIRDKYLSHSPISRAVRGPGRELDAIQADADASNRMRDTLAPRRLPTTQEAALPGKLGISVHNAKSSTQSLHIRWSLSEPSLIRSASAGPYLDQAHPLHIRWSLLEPSLIRSASVGAYRDPAALHRHPACFSRRESVRTTVEHDQQTNPVLFPTLPQNAEPQTQMASAIPLPTTSPGRLWRAAWARHRESAPHANTERDQAVGHNSAIWCIFETSCPDAAISSTANK